MNYAKAVETYLKRQSRTEHPDGHFDKARRWEPSGSERQECCSHIRGPSRAYPYSYMTHCRSIPHVAQLYGVREDVLRSLARNQDKIEDVDVDLIAQVIFADARIRDKKLTGARLERIVQKIKEGENHVEIGSREAA